MQKYDLFCPGVFVENVGDNLMRTCQTTSCTKMPIAMHLFAEFSVPFITLPFCKNGESLPAWEAPMWVSVLQRSKHLPARKAKDTLSDMLGLQHLYTQQDSFAVPLLQRLFFLPACQKEKLLQTMRGLFVLPAWQAKRDKMQRMLTGCQTTCRSSRRCCSSWCWRSICRVRCCCFVWG